MIKFCYNVYIKLMGINMNIAPLSIRVIIDIYETGLSALGKFKKANTCFFTTTKELDEFSESYNNDCFALSSVFQKLCRFVASNDYPKMNEVFTTEEKLIWSFSTRIYISNMKNTLELYEGRSFSSDVEGNILSACQEAVFIDNQIKSLKETLCSTKKF